ncbi:MAG: NADH-quinone oxidoreductase subunit J [Rhodothermales bacterium]|nr:NADH-quinone oxidoreductase subunit J [Rhodothermales bacterium]
MTPQFLFFCLAIVAITAALGMLIARSPVSSALWLILNLFCVAGLYLTMNAQFLAVVQVLVYAGAIMVLFLFVIMLLNVAALPSVRDIDWRLGVGFVLGVALLAQLSYAIASSTDLMPAEVSLESTVATGSVEVVAKELFTRFAMPLEMIGVLLLAATIGAVLLARRVSPK